MPLKWWTTSARLIPATSSDCTTASPYPDVQQARRSVSAEVAGDVQQVRLAPRSERRAPREQMVGYRTALDDDVRERARATLSLQSDAGEPEHATS